MGYEAENESDWIPSKQDSSKENMSVEIYDLLRALQKELGILRIDVSNLKKAKKEVRDYWGEQKDEYLCKKCIENNAEVCSDCFK